MNIVLTGFMGAGKSSVGRRVAERLGRPFFDTDDMLRRQCGRSIADLFTRGGEPAFREAESRAVSMVSLLDNAVIATGGGVPLNPSNMAELERNGWIVFLTATPEVLLARAAADRGERPLLAGGDPLAKAIDLLRERESAYNRCSFRIDTTHLTEPQVVDAVLAALPPRP